MWHNIKKWWFLKKFDEAIIRHTLKASVEDISSGHLVLLTQKFFIVGNEEYIGLATTSLKRFSKVLWWRRKVDPEKLKKRLTEYNNLFHICSNEGYISTEQTSQGLMPSRGKLFYDIYGFSGLLQLLGSKYTVAWAIMVAVLTFLLGRYWNQIIKLIFFS